MFPSIIKWASIKEKGKIACHIPSTQYFHYFLPIPIYLGKNEPMLKNPCTTELKSWRAVFSRPRNYALTIKFPVNIFFLCFKHTKGKDI
jgi:hypothetical protein